MILIGLLIIINLPIAVSTSSYSLLNEECGINNNLQAYYIGIDGDDSQDNMYSIIYLETIGVIYVGWDLTTLLLYACKIRVFYHLFKKTHKSHVYKRILSILHKIFILTIFYEISSLFFVALFGITHAILSNTMWQRVIGALINAANAIAISISIYLMMEHNRRKYLLFLRLVHKFRFDWICCKYRFIVMDQIEYIEEDTDEETNERKETIEYETKDLTVPNFPNPGDLYPDKTEPTVTVEKGPISTYID